MDTGRGLPQFGLRGFMETVAKGVKEQSKAEAEEKRESERIEEERRKEREAKREMWTKPGRRPLAEPPIIDWDYIFRTRIPSDLRYRALFPNDPEKRAAMKDVEGELAALTEYLWSVDIMLDDPGLDDTKRGFYDTLRKELYANWEEVNEEFEATFMMASLLSRFEYRFLDNDGKTTKLEEWVKKGANIIHGRCEEIKLKYKYLFPADFVENPIATFEMRWVDSDGGIAPIRREMREGNDILDWWPQVVQDKYGYLRRLLPPTTEPEDNFQRSSSEYSSEIDSDQQPYSDEEEGWETYEEDNADDEFSNGDDDHTAMDSEA